MIKVNKFNRLYERYFSLTAPPPLVGDYIFFKANGFYFVTKRDGCLTVGTA